MPSSMVINTEIICILSLLNEICLSFHDFTISSDKTFVSCVFVTSIYENNVSNFFLSSPSKIFLSFMESKSLKSIVVSPSVGFPTFIKSPIKEYDVILQFLPTYPPFASHASISLS